MKTVFIAEIGENHLGNIKTAKMLIKKAAEAGAEYVKFQSYTPKTFRYDDPEYDWFKKVYLTDNDHFRLKEHSKACGIKFLTSPFSLERAKFICEKLGLKEIKIASGMMLNFKVLDYINSVGIKKVFMSTGMAILSEIRQALRHLNRIPSIYLLHCVTQYPCKDKEANLRAIALLRKEFALPVGYSDHTVGIDACLVAVALGAVVIEKHFTFDKHCPEGTDHVLSATFDEFKEMVEKSKRIEVLLGDEVKRPTQSEEKILGFVRNRFRENG